MSHKRGYARLATRYRDIRVNLACGPACRFAHAGNGLFAAGGASLVTYGDNTLNNNSTDGTFSFAIPTQ